MKKRSLEEMVQEAKKTKFSIPPEVTSKKILLPEGVWSYVFRHEDLGELGRLLILPHENESQFSCEVCGDPDDPMTEKRRKILEPITRDMLEKMEKICGSGGGKIKPHNLSKEEHVIKSSIMPCEKCGEPTALMIIAPDTFSTSHLEDYARLMHAKVKELNAMLDDYMQNHCQ